MNDIPSGICIQDGQRLCLDNLSSVDNTLLKVLIIEGDGEHPLELKFPELRDIQEEYGLLQKTHAIRTSNGWSKVQ